MGNLRAELWLDDSSDFSRAISNFLGKPSVAATHATLGSRLELTFMTFLSGFYMVIYIIIYIYIHYICCNPNSHYLDKNMVLQKSCIEYVGLNGTFLTGLHCFDSNIATNLEDNLMFTASSQIL